MCCGVVVEVKASRIESKSGERGHTAAKDEDNQAAEDQIADILGPVALQTYSKVEIVAGYEKLYGK